MSYHNKADYELQNAASRGDDLARQELNRRETLHHGSSNLQPNSVIDTKVGLGCPLMATGIFLLVAIPLVLIGSGLTWFFLIRGGFETHAVTWEGTYTCDQGDVGIHMELSWSSIEGIGGTSNVTGTVSLLGASPAWDGAPQGAFTVKGTLENGQMELEPDVIGGLSPDAAWTRAIGQVGDDNATYEAIVEAEGCTALSVRTAG